MRSASSFMCRLKLSGDSILGRNECRSANEAFLEAPGLCFPEPSPPSSALVVCRGDSGWPPSDSAPEASDALADISSAEGSGSGSATRCQCVEGGEGGAEEVLELRSLILLAVISS